MFDLLLLLASTAVDTTPQVTSISATTLNPGLCAAGAVSTEASVRVGWTASNFDPALHSFYLYKDNILQDTFLASPFDMTVAGLVENDPHHVQTFTWTFRVDIVRASDSAVLASASTTITKSYGNCRTGLDQ